MSILIQTVFPQSLAPVTSRQYPKENTEKSIYRQQHSGKLFGIVTPASHFLSQLFHTFNRYFNNQTIFDNEYRIFAKIVMVVSISAL